jgi:hypothetical protein
VRVSVAQGCSMTSLVIGRYIKTAANRVARLFLVHHFKTGKNQRNYYQIYQRAVKYFKWPYNRPNVHKIYNHLPLQDPPKFTQTGIFGLKIYHLATLVANGVPSERLVF